MLCPYCNTFRPANKAPCPQCNAPSPLVEGSGSGYQTPWASSLWRDPFTPASSNGANGWSNQVPQSAYQGEANDNTLWAQVMAPQAVPGSVQQQPTLLPMPYQERTEGQQQMLKVPSPNLLKLPTIHRGRKESSLVPAIPGEEGTIYVPPMYTKPRAIIPRYRAVSGLISVFIVFALLCTGASYYAKATGKLSFLHQIYGDARPKNIKPTATTTLPIPQTTTEYGPASMIINSATTASKIDAATAQPLSPTNQFKVGDTIYLTYSVHPKSPGIVIAKWYTNNNFYQQSNSIAIKDAASGYIQIQFQQPAEGKVELYWNSSLAIRLYFVVEPAGS